MQKSIALITGASSDIGIALVTHLLKANCQVYGQYKTNKKALDIFCDHENFIALQHDLENMEHAKNLISQAVKQSSRLDILINALGPLDYQPLENLTPQQWYSQIHFNLNLAFYLAHYAQKYLIRAQGHIINFAFAGADILSARINSTAYCAAKAGIVVLTKSLAKALAHRGVRVNAISPGLIEASEISSQVRKNMAEGIPFGRPGTPDEVAEILTWLLFTSPSYITGALIPVAGAWEYI